MVKKDIPPILKEKWGFLDEQTTDAHRIKVKGEEFFAFVGFGQLLFTPDEVDTARKRFREWPDHLVTYPLWVLDRKEITDSAARLGLSLNDVDYNDIVESITTRVTDIFDDGWEETVDEEVEFVVNNRIAKEVIK
jgi:hypothetical protein